MSTVTIETYSKDTIKMTWSKIVTNEDVKQGFKDLDDRLSASQHPIFVIVDILSNPNLPIAATLTGALFGPYRNTNLREWLILGSNHAAQFIERTLSATTGRSIVRWFANQTEAEVYIAQTRENVA